MNRRELIRAVAAHTAEDAKQVESVLSGVTDVITAVVAKGEAVTIQGFAKFAKVERAARMGRNPRTGEAIRIKASKRVRVSPMKAFKDTVMSPSQAPRLASGVYPTSLELLAKQAAERRAAAAGARTPAATKTAAGKKAAGKKAAGKKAAAKKAPAKRAPAKTVTRKAVKKVVKKATRGTARPAAKRAVKRTVTAKRTTKKAPAKRAVKRTARR
jgi:DNA-binding protein HU-beta